MFSTSRTRKELTKYPEKIVINTGLFKSKKNISKTGQGFSSDIELGDWIKNKIDKGDFNVLVIPEIPSSSDGIPLVVTDSSNKTLGFANISATYIDTSSLDSYADDADASALSAGDLYITDGTGASPLDVAGILMVKL